MIIQSLKAFRSAVRGNDRRKLARALREVVKVSTGHEEFIATAELSGAFLWLASPQGHKFWQDTHTRARLAKHSRIKAHNKKDTY